MYSRALIRAAYNNETQIARRLIQSDECNVGAVCYDGWTALHWAAGYNNIELVRLLLQKDAGNIDAQKIFGNTRTALMSACYGGQVAIIELLIRSGANIDLKNSDNKTAFQFLDEDDDDDLSQEEKTRLKDLPRLIKQEQARQQRNQAQA
jgi:ankyrin repeat protein